MAGLKLPCPQPQGLFDAKKPCGLAVVRLVDGQFLVKAREDHFYFCVLMSRVSKPSSPAKTLLLTSEQDDSLYRVPGQAFGLSRLQAQASDVCCDSVLLLPASSSARALLFLDAACYGEAGPACPALSPSAALPQRRVLRLPADTLAFLRACNEKWLRYGLQFSLPLPWP